MEATYVDAEGVRPGGRRWRDGMRRASRRLLCCTCVSAEATGQRQEKTDGVLQIPCLDRGASAEEEEVIRITVEDLGMINPGFCLSEEDPPAPGGSMARSASASHRAVKRRELEPLSLLPIPARAEQPVRSSNGKDDEEDDLMLFDSGATTSGSLLTPPVINLIPPTPSDVIDDDQFFDVNSEESLSQNPGSCSAGDPANDGEEKEVEGKVVVEHVQPDVSKEARVSAKNRVGGDDEVGADGVQDGEPREEEEATSTSAEEKEEEERAKTRVLRSPYQVAPLPEYPRKRSFNAGINLLAFTEHNLDDLSNRDVCGPERLKADLGLLSYTAKMETVTRQQDMDRQAAKSLREMNTEEVCQWFSSVGLQKCLPFIRETELCGADIASIDVPTLDALHISTLEDRELLLSAIYKELHPPSLITQRVDSLLETFGPNNVERFTAALVSMCKSKSSPHVSCLNMNRSSLKLRTKSQSYMLQRNSQLIEITINASEQIVHLRTPRETTVGKVVESCIKMLGMKEDKDLLTLTAKQGSSEELSANQQIGSLLTVPSDNGQLELHLCKKKKPKGVDSQDLIKVNCSRENGGINQNAQLNQLAKEEKIRDLHQQVDSLQNVIRQVQELHHDLVSFCSELKTMDGEVDVTGLGGAELEQRLKMVQGQLKDNRQSLQTLKDNKSNTAAHSDKRLEVRLVDRMKLNCQVFKKEITLVHLNRRLTHLQNAMQDYYEKQKAQKKSPTAGSLGQLVSPQCPAMLLVVHESRGPDGRYGFACHHGEDSGLVVVQANNSFLCVDDRLVEVNGVPVVGSTEEELDALLLHSASAQIVVLRKPPTSPNSHLQPSPLDRTASPAAPPTVAPETETVATETPPKWERVAI